MTWKTGGLVGGLPSPDLKSDRGVPAALEETDYAGRGRSGEHAAIKIDLGEHATALETAIKALAASPTVARTARPREWLASSL
jgi:hypothetical protein